MLVLVQNIKAFHHDSKNGNQIYTITFFKKVQANSEMDNRAVGTNKITLLPK